MLILVQTISGALGVAIAALLFANDAPPWPIYAAAAGASAWAGTWAYARWRYGRGITVAPSWPARSTLER